MKKLLFIMSMVMMSATGFAKHIQTLVVTTNPQMHCAGCENKIKNGLKYEKGVKEIVTSVPNQTVTVKYDADKTSAEKLTAAFGKMGYTVRTLNAGEKVEAKPMTKCENKK